MENFIVSARKYRPQTFETVVGQRHITDTLQNAIRQNHLAQALLFTGPRGVGKTTCARILARAINAEDGQTLDDAPLNIFELDAASNNSVDDIRNLIDQVRFAPQVGRYKIYIIDEVHMLSQAAFNAFLKTLEEPPAHAIFILATTEKHKIIPTILSRCQIFDFRRITVEDIAGHLAHVAQSEEVQAEEEALHLIAQKADGALRDALSLFDRMVSFTGNHLTYKGVVENLNLLDYEAFFQTTHLVLQAEHAQLLLLFDDIVKRGFDGQLYLSGLADHLRNLLVASQPETVTLIEGGSNLRQRYAAQAQLLKHRQIIQLLDLVNQSDVRYKTSGNQRLLVELTLLQMAELLGATALAATPPATAQPGAPAPAAAPLAVAPSTSPTPVSTPPAAPAQVSAPPVVAVAPPPAAPAPAPVRTPPQLQSRVDAPPAPTPVTAKPSMPVGGILSKISLNKPAQVAVEAAPNLEEVPEAPAVASLPLTEPLVRDALQRFSAELPPSKKSLLDGLGWSIQNENTLFAEVDSKVMAQTIEEIKAQMMPFLRKELKNPLLQFELGVREQPISKGLRSGREIFDDMVAKNPLIENLRTDLGLEIE